MRRKFTPFHNKWHKIVEGQIRHTMGQHPEWFSVTKQNKAAMINSLAKRIVGEIAADSMLAAVPSKVTQTCNGRVENADVARMSHSRGDLGQTESPLFEIF